jgi:hypothetical protein
MPVGRILLKSISSSRKLAQLKTDGARLLYTWLIPHLNIHGCYEADPLVIRSHILSRLDKTVEEVVSYLEDLESAGLIQKYNVNGDIFLFVPDFKEKQPNLRPEREGKTHIPAPTPDLLLQNSRRTPAQVKLSKVKLSKVNIKTQPSAALKAAFDKLLNDKFNIYSLINRLKKESKVGIDIPEVVLLKVCDMYWKTKPDINFVWPWFNTVIVQELKTYNANNHEVESKVAEKRGPAADSIKKLIKGIGDA